MVAALTVYAARCTLNKTPLWTKTLKLHTGFYALNLERGSVTLLPLAKSLLFRTNLENQGQRIAAATYLKNFTRRNVESDVSRTSFCMHCFKRNLRFLSFT
ncbi:hypothetical protein Q3G72_029238 [Acer saccharum]|nr:hypothetical protein Q3G72_029238 [Acer saccharum]